MHWKLKALAQNGLGVLPGGKLLNDCLQRRFGELRHFERNVAAKIDDWKLTMKYLRDVNFDLRGKTVVEIGTGWHPTLPICFSLCGADCIFTYDVVRHLSSELTFRMLELLDFHLDSIAESSTGCVKGIKSSYRELPQDKNMSALLKLARVKYHAPSNALATGLPSESVDLVYSNSVMEHVPEDAIFGLMRESVRILRPGGLVLHNVACNDHYAHIDSKISFVNYLRFDESQWRRWNTALQYQNRLRASEFLEIAAKGGLEVFYKRTAVRPGTREALAKIEVAPQFRRFSQEDLLTTSLDFIARKPNGNGNMPVLHRSEETDSRVVPPNSRHLKEAGN